MKSLSNCSQESKKRFYDVAIKRGQKSLLFRDECYRESKIKLFCQEIFSIYSLPQIFSISEDLNYKYVQVLITFVLINMHERMVSALTAVADIRLYSPPNLVTMRESLQLTWRSSVDLSEWNHHTDWKLLVEGQRPECDYYIYIQIICFFSSRCNLIHIVGC